MALLEVDDLRTHFFTREGVVRAVDGVSFAVEKGKTLGIVGESGCGKSVTALSIMGLIPKPPAQIVSGSVLYEGRDLTKLSERQLEDVRGREIAMIFQDPMTSLNPTLTIGTQITETIRRHYDVSQKQADKKAVELLEKVRIPRAAERLKDYPHRFSGGMRQRVMIAIALSCDPKLLIADEPTTALDVTVQASVLDLLDDLRHEYDMSMIIITHDMGVVAEAADDIIVMYAGQVVEHALDARPLRQPRASLHRGAARSAAATRGREPARGAADRDPGPPSRPARPAEGMPLRATLPLRRQRRLHRARAGAARDPARALGPLGASGERARQDARAAAGAARERREGAAASGDGAAQALPDPRRPADRAQGGGGPCRGRRQLRRAAGRDAQPRRRVRLRQVDDRLLRAPAAEAHLRLGPVRGDGADASSVARTCAGCAARCRSSSRTRTRRSIRA